MSPMEQVAEKVADCTRPPLSATSIRHFSASASATLSATLVIEVMSEIGKWRKLAETGGLLKPQLADAHTH